MEEKNFETEVKEERREYFRAWRAANKEKVRANNRRYWERRALKRRQEKTETEEEKA